MAREGQVPLSDRHIEFAGRNDKIQREKKKSHHQFLKDLNAMLISLDSILQLQAIRAF